MKYLWLSHAIPYPPKAGFLLRSYNLLRGLARCHTVDLIAFVQETWVTTLFPSLEEGLAESRSALGELCGTVTFLPIDKLRRPLGKQLTAFEALLSGSSYMATWLTSASAQRAIAHQLDAGSYDLVHFDTIGLAPYRDLVRVAPATMTHHNIESHMMLRRAESTNNTIARWYFQHEGRALQRFEAQTGSKFAAHITCSELDTIRLRQIVPEANIAVVPNGVDCTYFVSAKTATRPDSLVFVGTMNWYPNIDAMLFFLGEVWPRLKKRIPAVTLDVAGSNPPVELVRLARSLPGVTVHGYIPDVRPLVDSAAVFVCPIRDGGGTKLKVLDAFAMGKCVVAHPVACEGIDVTCGRDVVYATTPEDFITQIAALLGDSDRRREIGRAARRLVETQYSYQNIGAQFNSLLEETVRRSVL
jgi:glycosyltransferase involved in cell wall biosynthesis